MQNIIVYVSPLSLVLKFYVQLQLILIQFKDGSTSKRSKDIKNVVLIHFAFLQIKKFIPPSQPFIATLYNTIIMTHVAGTMTLCISCYIGHWLPLFTAN